MKIIAIDGPAGSGKSSVAKKLATELNYAYLDTGGMYRSITYYLIQNKIDLDHKHLIISQLDNINIDYSEGNYSVNGQLLSSEIRTPIINQNVSKVAAIKEVRQYCVKIQRKLAEKYNTILDGRDIASVVFPNADFKFYLDASPETRALRRFEETKYSENAQTYEEVLQDIKVRDDLDKNRIESPLIRVEDAIYIDTSSLSLKQVVKLLKAEIEVSK